MRKLFGATLVLALIAFTACAGKTKENNQDVTTTKEEKETKHGLTSHYKKDTALSNGCCVFCCVILSISVVLLAETVGRSILQISRPEP